MAKAADTPVAAMLEASAMPRLVRMLGIQPARQSASEAKCWNEMPVVGNDK